MLTDKEKLIRVIGASWLVLIAAIFSPLIDSKYFYVTPAFILFVTASFAAFYGGAFLGLRLSYFKKHIKIKPKTFVLVVFVVALTAVIFRLVDRLYIRPPTDYLSIASYRDAREVGSNLFSVLAAMLFAVLAAFYARLATLGDFSFKGGVLRKFIFIFAMILVLDVFLSGSRGILLFSLMIMFAHKVTLTRAVLSVFVITFLSSVFFAYRFMETSQVDSLRLSDHLYNLSLVGYSQFVPMSDFSRSFVFEDGFSSIAFSVLQANQYLAHGFFEFAYIFSTHPAFQLDPSKLIPQLSKIFVYEARLDRPNLYYTLIGSSYLAFGFFSLLTVPAIGFIMGIALRQSVLVSPSSQFFMLSAFFLAPFVNSFGGYDAILFISAIILTSLIRSKSLVSKK